MREQRYPIEVRAEARRIADRTGAETIEDLARIEAAVAHQFWWQAIEPWLSLKTRPVLNFPPGYFLVDGRLEVLRAEPDAATRETLTAIDEQIAAEARRFGLETVQPPAGEPRQS